MTITDVRRDRITGQSGTEVTAGLLPVVIQNRGYLPEQRVGLGQAGIDLQSPVCRGTCQWENLARR